MTDDYPSQKDLDFIPHWKWDTKNNELDLINIITSLWHWGEDRYKFKKYKNGKWKLYLSTGGWSGNEDIINAIKAQKPPGFYFWFWQKSQKGGHYWFARNFINKKMKS